MDLLDLQHMMRLELEDEVRASGERREVRFGCVKPGNDILEFLGACPEPLTWRWDGFTEKWIAEQLEIEARTIDADDVRGTEVL